MSDTSPFGFGRFVPGFDFLQNLAKGASAGIPTLPGLSGWVAPTVSVEELDKRIQELKAVQFWLEQNARALAATVQAREVQKMTLVTLKDMNVAMGDLASVFSGARSEDTRSAAPAPKAAPPAPKAPPPEPAPEPEAEAKPESREDAAPAAASGVVDPMRWWGALTSQFQQIAANAMKDAGSQQAALDATRDMASGALKSATDMAVQLATQGMKGAKRAAPKKAAAAPRKAPSTARKAPAAKKRSSGR